MNLQILLGLITLGVLVSFMNREFGRYDVVEGDHSLWDGVSIPYRETIRAFLVYFQNEVCLFGVVVTMRQPLPLGSVNYGHLPLKF